MCGILGITGQSVVTDRLIEGLKRLEYRGYDSAGLAVHDSNNRLDRRRAKGKIVNLEAELEREPLDGSNGIAHTRWATHGVPSQSNAHPHVAGPIAIVHNGIIENFRELRSELIEAGYAFESETDSEVIAKLIQAGMDSGQPMTQAFAAAIKRLRGAYGLAALCETEPGQIWAAREGSPLVVGLGEGETFIGSDSLALAGWSRRVIYLEEGDWCCVTPQGARVFDCDDREVVRQVKISSAVVGFADKGGFRHFMEKEIHEQPDSVARTLSQHIDPQSGQIKLDLPIDWNSIGRVHASACGTAFYAVSVARYWFEHYARIGLEADIASEFRYREPVINCGDLALFVSQSGETADTLAALRYARSQNAQALGVVNVQESSIARECDAILQTQAGPEIGVASTKAFTAQLVAMACLAVHAARERQQIDPVLEAELATALLELPRRINEALAIEPEIEKVARSLISTSDVLYLGRGAFYPIALEGALKLKEISYIHAEGYAAGELKHGPIALIEEGTPVIVVAPFDGLFEKTLSNVQEVIARGAEVIMITDKAGAEKMGEEDAKILIMPDCHRFIQPIISTIPIQLLAYYTASLKGTDVDQPRNLAKSVTVE
jgi:glucosamine--fructose-6-phosphate aminotransferase (isomerizing)